MIQLSPLLHRALNFIGKFASRLTVSNSSICSEHIQIEVPDFCDCGFTIKTRDLVTMLKYTNEFSIKGKELQYSYEVCAGGSLINFEKVVNAYEETYKISSGIPLLNIVVNGFRVLSSDDHEIKADKKGNFTIQSFGVIETRTEYTGLRVIENIAESVNVKVRARDLYVLEKLDGDIIFSFLDSHILVYSLADDITIVVQIKILSH